LARFEFEFEIVSSYLLSFSLPLTVHSVMIVRSSDGALESFLFEPAEALVTTSEGMDASSVSAEGLALVAKTAGETRAAFFAVEGISSSRSYITRVNYLFRLEYWSNCNEACNQPN
jgi:hypothetical protein